MGHSFYERLGVSEDATDEAVLDAYRDHLRMAHTGVNLNRDHHHTKDLYVAYSVLSDRSQRERYDEALSSLGCPWCGQRLAADDVEHHVSNHAVSKAHNGCIVCGRLPVRRFSYRSVDGWLLWHRKHSVEGNLCQTCSTGEFRTMQARNLVRGPWGIFSIFMTPYYLARNWAAHRKTRLMQPPQPYDAIYDKSARGRPTLARASVGASVLLLAAAAVLVGQLVGSQSNQAAVHADPVMPATVATVDDTNPWTVGVCARVDMAGRPTPAPCDGNQYASVIEMVDTAAECPKEADWTLPAGEVVACFENA